MATRHPPNLWGMIFGAAAILLICCATGWSGAPFEPVPPSPATDSIADGAIANRLQAVEEQNRQLSERLERLSREYEEQMYQLREQLEGTPFDGKAADGTDLDPSASPIPDYTEGNFAPMEAAPGYPGSNLISAGRMPLYATFGPGFQLRTKDEQFSLQVHYESQIELREWSPSRDNPGNSGFFMPRQRIFFTGTMTKNIEYELSINRGVNNINLLNAYLNFHFDDRLQVRIGRFFTPFLYDQYAISNYWLLTPERSLFTTNLSTNRQIGTMAWGYLWDKRVDYAVGVFNGSRNSFESLNNELDMVTYFNIRPFQESEDLPWMKFFNVGTSFTFGNQDQSPSPGNFRIGAGSPDTNIPSTATTPFLTLNSGVIEKGQRTMGSVHMAYYYNSLSLIGEWQYANAGYASAAQPSSRTIPFTGFYVSSGYFLTGEHVERRTRVKPLRPFVPLNKTDRRGPGAWELAGRVSQLRIGNQIFSEGFADPTIWTDSATTTELGMNWYWNDYMKFYAFWLHGDFAQPVQIRPGELNKSVDMLWLRCQLYF